MTRYPIPAALVALTALTAAPAWADSVTLSASSAGSAASASSRGSSESFKGSSASSRDDKRARVDGDYRIASIEEVDGRPGMLRLAMQPVGADSAAEAVELILPRPALGQRGMVAGDRVHARQRAYGLEFARQDTREAFFLVLADGWEQGLATRQVRP